jgi:hypothetical protein
LTGWGDNVATWVPVATYHAVALVDLERHVALCGASCPQVDVERTWAALGDEGGVACPKCIAATQRRGSGHVSDPTLERLDAYMQRVNDVARRFTKLPAEQVLRALRAELAGSDQDEASLADLAGRIARGEFIAPLA